MNPIAFGDLLELRIRLEVLAQEADRRLVTVFGSGISNSVLPGVPELTELFREHVPRAGRARFDATIDALPDPGLKYQNAAAILTRQAGEHTVMRAIRTAVLQACRDVPKEEAAKVARNEEQCRALVRDTGSWEIPLGYQRFAHFFASLDGSVRGPVITTNFDPLIEIALTKAGVDAVAIPVTTDSAPTPDQLREATTHPVLHLHGYWTGPATSNVPSRITADRPQLDAVLQKMLTNSVVLVVGYSGWLDGFMKSLRSRILNDADLLQAEVLWAAHESEPADALGDGVLNELVSAPGFSLYLGIDGHELFGGELDADGVEAQEKASPFGYSRVPRRAPSSQYDPAHFAEGRRPDWDDAGPGRWPVLSSTQTLEQELLDCLENGGGGGVVAIGPLGEGKSLAVRQVAMSLASSRQDWDVLWREPGAPPISESWLSEVRNASDRALICIDEADLVMDELVATQRVWGVKNSGFAFLLASHDRLWWQGAGSYLRPHISPVLFHGITSEDAGNIAAAWQTMGLLPSSLADAEAAAARLAASAGAMATETNTLFGAVLDVRYGPELGHRVEDLLRKLGDIDLTDTVTLGDVFAGICVMQHTLDRDGNRGKGASRSVIAEMVGKGEVFADGKILRILGREAAVTFAGDRVYSRHPAIASAVVDYLHRDGSAQKVYTLVGRAGGALRAADASEIDGFRDAYLLSRNLSVPEAVWAATGAVEGTGPLLESRVSLLRALRREGGARPVKYARDLAAHVHEYRDSRAALRGFLVEFSNCMRDDGHAQTSAGLAALALDDRVGFRLDSSRAGYALVSLAKSALRLNAQTGRAAANDTPEIAYVLLQRIRGEDEAEKFLGTIRTRLAPLDEFRRLSAVRLCALLASALGAAAKSAMDETQISLGLDDSLSFDTLRRLAVVEPGGR
ncbi:SIR2 family protein [Streptomyces sp. TP-A0356]|uniref:P-loop NTPase n=1 Tax=Streptomyces sp. TP-A0356 TaxID=1359208 RepID=UPI0006E35574|nr:SIR2 family protein [Streptomyces sp. TP-A0356]